MAELTITIDEAFGKLDKAERRRIINQLYAIDAYKRNRRIAEALGVETVTLVWN